MEAQGEAPKPNRDVETRMDVHVNAYLPAEYVTGDRQRLEVYKRIASITTAAQRDDVEEELVDRFGDEPLCVANLVAVAYLKAMCEKLGIDRVNQADGRIDMRFALNAQVDGQKLFTALNGFDKRLTLNAAPPVTLTLRDQMLNREDLLMLCVKVMERGRIPHQALSEGAAARAHGAERGVNTIRPNLQNGVAICAQIEYNIPVECDDGWSSCNARV